MDNCMLEKYNLKDKKGKVIGQICINKRWVEENRNNIKLKDFISRLEKVNRKRKF